MNDVSRILDAIDQGDGRAAEQLLPLVYEELRKLAARQLAQDKSGQTLQPTALVHEAYLRLVASADGDSSAAADPAALPWKNRGHFFAAAAEAMRRILIERARRKRRLKHGGGRKHIDLAGLDLSDEGSAPNLLALDEALVALAEEEPVAAQVDGTTARVRFDAPDAQGFDAFAEIREGVLEFANLLLMPRGSLIFEALADRGGSPFLLDYELPKSGGTITFSAVQKPRTAKIRAKTHERRSRRPAPRGAWAKILRSSTLAARRMVKRNGS